MYFLNQVFQNVNEDCLQQHTDVVFNNFYKFYNNY